MTEYAIYLAFNVCGIEVRPLRVYSGLDDAPIGFEAGPIGPKSFDDAPQRLLIRKHVEICHRAHRDVYLAERPNYQR